MLPVVAWAGRRVAPALVGSRVGRLPCAANQGRRRRATLQAPAGRAATARAAGRAGPASPPAGENGRRAVSGTGRPTPERGQQETDWVAGGTSLQ